MNRTKTALGISEADKARDDLYATLSLLRERLDFAQRIDDRLEQAKHRIAAEKRERPLVFVAGVVAVAIAGGALVWGLTSKTVRFFRQ